jgi:Fe-S-cluster containining protein
MNDFWQRFYKAPERDGDYCEQCGIAHNRPILYHTYELNIGRDHQPALTSVPRVEYAKVTYQNGIWLCNYCQNMQGVKRQYDHRTGKLLQAKGDKA